MVSNICGYNSQGEKFRLIGWFYYYSYFLDLVEEGNYSTENLLKELSEFSKATLKELQHADAGTKIRLLMENIDEPPTSAKHVIETLHISSAPSKWYEFWQ